MNLISAILLAAGESRRMGGRDKLLLVYEGKTLLLRAAELLDSLPCYEKIMVTTESRLLGLDIPYSVRAIANSNPEAGLSGSVRLGLEAASGDQFLFLNADQPLLSLDNLLPMIRMAGENPEKIIFPTISGRPCTPTVFPARFRNDLCNLHGDTGGRVVRDAYPNDCLTFEADNPKAFSDIDDEEGYNRIIRNSGLGIRNVTAQGVSGELHS